MAERWFTSEKQARAARQSGERLIRGNPERRAQGVGLSDETDLDLTRWTYECLTCGGWQGPGNAVTCDCVALDKAPA